MPTFKGYRGFPGSICASPERDGRARHPRALRACSAATSSRSTSASRSTAGSPTPRARSRSATIDALRRKLLEATEESLHAGVEQCRAGNRLGDISHAIQAVVEGAGLSVVRSLVGHGVGRNMHEDPQIPNYGEPGKGPLLEEGMVLAIEPMITAGAPGGADRATTAGRSTPRTARWRRTSSSRSRSRPTGPQVLTPWHIPAAERAGRARGASAPPTEPAGRGRCGVATIWSPARARAAWPARGRSATR